VVASFDDAILAHFKTFAPDVATSPGLGEMVQWFGTRDAMPHHRVLQVPPVYSGLEVVTQQFVDDAHADGLAVWVWFNGTDDDQADEWNRLLDLGVDALLTGRPAAAQATLDERYAAFTAAPQLGETWTMHPRRVHGTYACPAVHVARCRSLLVLVTINGKGREHLAGLGVVGARRGTERAVAIARVPARGRVVQAMLIAFPIGDDTATVGGAVTIQRV
jgi:Glycerophosphoryl diester phosphodiesterase family